MTKIKKKVGRPKITNPKWAGRKPILEGDTLTKLELAFSYWLTDDEACLFVNISPPTLYRYINKNPEFWKKKELLKNKPKIKAKMNVLEALNSKNIDVSKWYLERKAKWEFGTKEINVEWDATIFNQNVQINFLNTD